MVLLTFSNSLLVISFDKHDEVRMIAENKKVKNTDVLNTTSEAFPFFKLKNVLEKRNDFNLNTLLFFSK
jgi:hypothetical protein